MTTTAVEMKNHSFTTEELPNAKGAILNACEIIHCFKFCL